MKITLCPILLILLGCFNSQRSFSIADTSELYLNQRKMITDSKPEHFGYPSQILIRANIGRDILKKRENKLKVLYYAFQVPSSRAGNPPSKRYLVFEVNKGNTKDYIAIQSDLIGWPSYSIAINEKLMSSNLNTIKRNFSI